MNKDLVKPARTIVIEPTRLDYSGASVFGPTVLLFQRGDTRPCIYHPALAEVISDKLDAIGYRPDVDYIVLAGQTLLVNVATSLIAARYGRFRALAFNSHDDSRGYEPVVLGRPLVADAVR